jgi:hypothetical protein
MADRDIPSSGKAISEPENSTVDDWLGQRVSRDEQLADRLVEQSGGDEQEAARRFAESSKEGDEYREQHQQS